MTDPQQIFQLLETKGFHQRKILSHLKKCLKKFSFKSPSALWNLNHLTMWLYIHGYEEDALQAIQIIEEVPFQGNFEIWEPIEALLLLEARIQGQRGNLEKAQANRAKVMAPYEPHQEAFRRQLAPGWLNDKNIAHDEAASNPKGANAWRFGDLESLIFMRELGEGQLDIDGHPVQMDWIENRINEYIAILKNIK